MASTYTTGFGIEKIGSGEQSGTWGTTTNHNLDIVDRIASYKAVGLSGTTHTLTVREASPGSGTENLQDGMYRVIKFTGALGANNTVTIAPNTSPAWFIIENATTDSGSSGPYSVILTQGSGANVTVQNGKNAIIYCDGAGSGAVVYDALADIQVGTLEVTGAAAIDGALTQGGASQFNSTLTVGVNDTGYDVKLFGATSGKSLLWDESADSLIVTGTTTLVGTTNLDAVDIDGAVQIDGTVTVGVNDTGYDVKLFGATSGAYMLWDESADDLKLVGAAGLTVAGDSVLASVRAAFVAGTSMLLLRNLSGNNRIDSYNEPISATYPLVINSSVCSFNIADSEKMRLTSTGLGIGTTITSNAKLTVDQGTSTYTIDLVGQDSSDVASIRFINNAYSAVRAQLTAIAAGGLITSVNNTEKMRVNATGVGIGTTAPVAPLAVVGGTSNASNLSTAYSLAAFNITPKSTSGYSLQFGSGPGDKPYIQMSAGGSSANTINLQPYGGYVGIGMTGDPAAMLQVDNSSVAILAKNTNTSNLSTPALQVSKGDNNSTTSNVLVQFFMNGVAAGQGHINANGGAQAAFGSFSDRRLKENIVDLPPQLANILTLRPVEFDYIESEGGSHQIGFIAQNVQEVYPDLVGEREDGMLTLSDLNKNDARLIKAIQEQQALIEALTTRITTLEG
jgi:hypothetical protein